MHAMEHAIFTHVHDEMASGMSGFLEGVATVVGMTGPQLSGLEMRVGRALPVLGKR